ncbi:hypothetical protein [Helicobacter bilis]|uniref:hypothetical protein n=2 Tax=Helicobacter bilis TaxID=37372 RepID=UPI002A82AAF4|nr:hypothetical protein [Helicobacter bilis]MDY4400400.1 hypothetical protein [Helicobacter bilis]
MRTFFRILYAGWLGFCVLVFILSLSMAYQVSFFGSLFMTFLLAITPYCYFLCIFKIPIDFEVWCIHHNHNMNDFILFFKKYWLYYIFPLLFLVSVLLLKIDLSLLLFLLPFIWLYIILFKKTICFIVDKIRGGGGVMLAKMKGYNERQISMG